MGRKTKWNTSDAMHQIGNESWIVREMGMQMIDLFSSSVFIEKQQINKVNGLKKTLPAVTGLVTLIDDWMDRDIGQGAQVSLEIQPGDFSMLPEPVS